MRLRILVSAATALAVAACEDGPTQVYKPSPAGAADRWNDGRTAGSADGATQPFVTDNSGTNKQQICSGPQKAARWAQMVQEPIVPPTRAAGLDLSGGPSWKGVTIGTAEQLNCQSENAGDAFGDGTQVNQWGDNGEVWVQYQVSTRKIIQISLFPGYLGTMDFKSKDGRHSYQLAVSTQIQKDALPFALHWTDPPRFAAEADELFLALMATYAPGLPAQAGCLASGRCIRGSFGDGAYFYVPALGWAIWIDNQNAPQPTPSIPTRIDQSPAKVMPFAYANPLLKLDAEGPTGAAGKLGSAALPCVLKMGLDYGDFLRTCVQVTADPQADQVELNKLIGGISHNEERFSFDVEGVDLNFTDNRLGPHDIVRDADRPAPSDTATELAVDQSTLGNIANDHDAAGNLDLHGAGAVYREYARLVRTELLHLSGIADGDVRKCLYPPGFESDPEFDPAVFEQHLPRWCTGFEGFLTAAPPTDPGDPNNLGVGVVKVSAGYSLGLKLGHQQATFCMDPTGDPSTGYRVCAGPYGATGDVFSTSFARVVKFLGKGDVLSLPVDVRDVRFFFKQYVIALVKYLHVGGQNPVPDLATVGIEMDDLFFDSQGAGQFELGEYIDRRFATRTQTPTDFVITADVKNGIFARYDFSRDLYRGEEAIYRAMLESPNDGLGQEGNALLSNVFGSPVLRNGWHASSGGKSAYYCATTIDPGSCDGQLPPLDGAGGLLRDDLGRPILSRYPGAFAGAATTFSLGPTGIRVKEVHPELQEAVVGVPTTANPYDPASAAGSFDVFVPWLPRQPGVGFQVPLSGTLDKFIETAQMDFSGTTISANLDYGPVIDPATGQPAADGSLQLLAVETTDFLGDVFLCQDPSSGDLLRARMYTPVQNILDWLGAHPNARQACGMVIRYSPFNNYADYITSLTNGVTLGVTQGGGFGRVVDVTLFVPGQ